MKILLLNPNTSVDMTERMVATAAPALAPDTELVLVTAPHGMPYIASRAEAVIAGTITLDLIARHHDEVDVIVIAAFGDPSLVAARELFAKPVVGMAEAAMLTACMLGERFAMVTFSPTLVAWYEDAVALARLESRFTGVRVPAVGFRSVATVQHELEDELVEMAACAVEKDRADVVILAGAPLTGLAARVAERIPVPVIDPLTAAVCQAQSLFRLAPSAARAGRFARPGPKPTTGLPPSLADWIEHRERGEPSHLSVLSR